MLFLIFIQFSYSFSNSFNLSTFIFSFALLIGCFLFSFSQIRWFFFFFHFISCYLVPVLLLLLFNSRSLLLLYALVFFCSIMNCKPSGVQCVRLETRVSTATWMMRRTLREDVKKEPLSGPSRGLALSAKSYFLVNCIFLCK